MSNEHPKVRYFSSYTEDFTESAQQNYTLPEDYKWIRTDPLSKLLSALIYGCAVIFSPIYCKLALRLRIKGKKNIKSIKGGYFIYGNHTQPVGDVFTPALCVLPKRIYTIASPANFGIPILGRILPYLGALPTADTLKGTKQLTKAIEQRISEGHPIVIYPEAHVWQYYTDIRPFSDTSFKFPAKLDVPAVAMTVTYQKTKLRKRPKMVVYLSKPINPQGNTQKEKCCYLHSEITNILKQNSKRSNTEYIKYIKIGETENKETEQI